MNFKEQLLSYAEEHHQIRPDRPFPRFPTYLALRHPENNKIFGLFMDVRRKKPGLTDRPEEYTDILTVKIDPELRMMIVGQPGILAAYHMHAGSWISILLDGSVACDQIVPLLEMSFELTSGKSGSGRTKSGFQKTHNPNWIVPANPKYYDIEQAVADGDGEFIWKQSNTVFVGDIVYLYVAAPVSAIRYRCRVIEADIPYPYEDKNVSIKKVMRLHLLHTYNRESFPINVLKSFGVTTVRGPRSVPPSLLHELELYINTST